jgi:hypothetical protein
VLAFLCLIAPAAAPAEGRAKADEPDRILVVTKGHPGFQYRGVFYPAGMDPAEFVQRFGEPDMGASESVWQYEKRRVNVGALRTGAGPDRKLLFFTFHVRSPARVGDPPATDVVTDTGIDHRSTPADVVKAHGEPADVRADERDGRERHMVYVSRGERGGSRRVSFVFKGETLERIMTTAVGGLEPAPKATTVPAGTTRPSR